MHFKCLPPSDPNAAWPYCPSFGAAVFFSILFFIVTVTHIVEAVVYRKPFCWVLIMGAIWETAGLAFRALSVTKPSEIYPAFVSDVLVLLAPLWINAFAYMTLGRIMYFFLPDTSTWHIKPQRLTVLFVLLDIVTFLVQAVGASMVSSSNPVSTQRLGIHLYMGGVGLQQGFIVIFTALAVTFHFEVRRRYLSNTCYPDFASSTIKPTTRGSGIAPRSLHLANITLGVLYTVLGLISIRIIYRLSEYSSGSDSYLPTHEWPSYVFDFLVMVSALVVLAIGHPGRFIWGEGSHWPTLTRKQKKTAKRQRKQEKRERKQQKKWDHDSPSELMDSTSGSEEVEVVAANLET